MCSILGLWLVVEQQRRALTFVLPACCRCEPTVDGHGATERGLEAGNTALSRDQRVEGRVNLNIAEIRRVTGAGLNLLPGQERFLRDPAAHLLDLIRVLLDS